METNVIDRFKIREGCFGCSQRSETYFCSLPEGSLKQVSFLAVQHRFPKGSTLFIQGETANGIYLLCAGRVKLLTYSEDGRSLIVRIAEPGEALGMSACVAGVPYESSAQTLDRCYVKYICRKEFLELLKRDSDVASNAIRELSLLYHKAHTQICALGLSATASDKLARLFLEWCGKSTQGGPGVHIRMTYTHEEIAEMIGTSRETVTRLLKRFKERKLIRLKGSDLFIPNPNSLARAIGSGARPKRG